MIYTFLLYAHNVLRWVLLILLVVAILRHLAARSQNRAVNNADRKVDFYLMLTAHIQLLIGFYQWFAGPWGLKNIQNLGMGEVMRNSVYRFWAIEHLTGMLIGIILITVARGRVKRALGPKVHSGAALLFFLALVVILATVPWPFRENIARPLLPGL